MAYQLTMEMAVTSIGIGAYQRPLVYLTDSANEDFKTLTTNATLTATGSVGYLLNSPAGFILYVATAIGTGRINATLVVGGVTLQAYIDITVTADYDWGIIDSGDTETPTASRSSVPFAKYSGYNKGVKRPFASDEQTYLTDSVQTLTVPQAETLDIITPFIVGSQSFDVSDIQSTDPSGWGLTGYGDTDS